MGKLRSRLARVLFIAFALCVLAVAPAQFALTQEPATTGAARNAALIAATDEVLKETSAVRQLAVLRPVQSSTQSRAEIERAVVKNLDEDTSAADLHAAEVTLKKLGLVPPDFQYRALMIRLLTEQVAGYYEPKTRQFHLAEWIDVEGQRPVMAHELTHALQDQHFDLRRFEHWPKGDADAELAAHSLIEGDATLAMVMYISTNPLRFLKSLRNMDVETREFNQAPRVIRESLLFPYQEGLNWTRAVYKEGGWAQVSQAFKTLPQSTEQILHPEKYLAHEAPVKVTLPDVTSLLNKDGGKSVPPASAGGSKTPVTWKRIYSDVNGEWGTYLLLDQFLDSPADSRRAAAGWAGDRYAVYESSAGKVIFVSVSVWDSDNDAREFFDAYGKRINLRYPAAQPRDHFENADAKDRIASWTTNDGAVVVKQSGTSVFVIEGVPGGVDSGRLLAMMKQ